MGWNAILALLALAMMMGCAQNSQVAAPDAGPDANIGQQRNMTAECITACRSALDNGADFSSGPCLLDPIPNSSWVCDVVHEPRLAVDDRMANQCPSFGKNGVDHFVEVDLRCSLVRLR